MKSVNKMEQPEIMWHGVIINILTVHQCSLGSIFKTGFARKTSLTKSKPNDATSSLSRVRNVANQAKTERRPRSRSLACEIRVAKRKPTDANVTSRSRRRWQTENRPTHKILARESVRRLA